MPNYQYILLNQQSITVILKAKCLSVPYILRHTVKQLMQIIGLKFKIFISVLFIIKFRDKDLIALLQPTSRGRSKYL